MYESKADEELRREFEGYCEEILLEAGQRHTLKKEDAVQFNRSLLQQFWMFREQDDPQCLSVWRVTSSGHSFAVAVVSIRTEFRIGRGHCEIQRHLHLFGLLYSPVDFGESVLQPETMRHKMQEWFTPMETDFNRHPAFSRKYYCLTRHPNLFRKAMTVELMDYLAGVKDLELEFHHQYACFKTNTSIIKKEKNLQLFDIGMNLCALLH